MARIAGHPTLVVEILLVDVEHHLHHVPRVALGLLVVLVERLLNVAILAVHTQRCRHELHRRNQLVRRHILQDLYVFELLRRGLWLTVARRYSIVSSALLWVLLPAWRRILRSRTNQRSANSRH